MLRSLYTGISGLRSHQTMMDVTGNNIANVNTTGYKTANTIFEDTLSQTLANAGAPQGQQGGTNPAQVGLGVRVAGITTNFSQGATQVTGRNTDMLISGDGFFVVRNNGINQYTRNGSFSADANGTLVSLGGAPVMGWEADDNGAVNTSNALTPLTIPIGDQLDPQATENVTLRGTLDSTIDNLYGDAANPGDTHILKYPIYDANGANNDMTVEIRPMVRAGGLVAEWDVVVSHPGLTPSVTSRLIKDYTTGEVTLGGNTDLRLPVAGVVGGDGATTFDFNLDMNRVAIATRIGTTKSDVSVQSQDGAPPSTLSSWKVSPDGSISGTFSDGRTQDLGRIAIANFDNPAGLDKQGGSTYAATINSGEAAVGSAGDAGRGTITSGALEMSNVDLAQEFTNLIVSQRGFQANSRVITTSDQMLEELVNLKR